MSAGLAHEINNPLQVMKTEYAMIEDIISDLEKCKGPPAAEDMNLLKDSVKQIDIQIERCGRITSGLLRFARKVDISEEAVKLQEFVPEVVSMVEKRALLENIRIVQELDLDLPAITSDPNQLQQVFVNLLNNAIHALSAKEFGEIRIKVSRENSHITFSIADNGCGVSPEDMEKIFLPFFTTRPIGQGTGLGLSTAYGIINGMGGEITVTSELNAGTVFTVRLPVKPPEKKNNNR
jgi:two-component system NtrC family sensor kinase